MTLFNKSINILCPERFTCHTRSLLCFFPTTVYIQKWFLIKPWCLRPFKTFVSHHLVPKLPWWLVLHFRSSLALREPEHREWRRHYHISLSYQFLLKFHSRLVVSVKSNSVLNHTAATVQYYLWHASESKTSHTVRKVDSCETGSL